MARTLLAVLAAAAVSLTGLGVASTSAASAAVPPPPSGWTSTWVDDFDAPAGTAPDARWWRPEVGGGGWGNDELQHYTASTRNAATDGRGNLVISAHEESGRACWYGPCTYTSARLVTADRLSAKYGRVEARIKVPSGKGLWPAFWMLGTDLGSVGWPNSGEIDVMEIVGDAPGRVHGSLHGPGYSGGSALTGSYTRPAGGSFADGFHTYRVDWSPTAIDWYVDDVHYSRKTPADAGANRWVFDHDFFLILNLAVGGTWPGTPAPETAFPAQMLVDYVATWQASAAPVPAPVRRSAYVPLQAEDTSASSGTATEPTTDLGGGRNLGWVSSGDWARYDGVDFGSGADQITARTASAAGHGGSIEVRLDRADAPPVATVPVTSTGGWQTWRSVSASLPGITGVHDVFLRFTSATPGDFLNLNWLSFRKARTNGYGTLQAEWYDGGAGIRVEDQPSGSAGQSLGWIADGDWVRYDEVAFGGRGAGRINVRTASGSTAAGTVEVRLDSPTARPVATIPVSSTGGWSSWVTRSAAVPVTTGVHSVYLTFRSPSGQEFVNVDTLRFDETVRR